MHLFSSLLQRMSDPPPRVLRHLTQEMGQLPRLLADCYVRRSLGPAKSCQARSKKALLGRRRAAQKLAVEKPGQTLPATDLAHEAKKNVAPLR
jgi:hypothetical protein